MNAGVKVATGNNLLVFTDMDGSLLDHHDYSYAPARPLLERLELAGIPVIPNTSKTRVELEQLREALGNRHPFVAENGAAVFIPAGYFDNQPEGTQCYGEYWVHEMSAPRQHWLAILDELASEFAGEFTSFQREGAEGVAALTGLSPVEAALANQREYSEPVAWLGSAERRSAFVVALRMRGANPLQGGRFLTLAGDCDKGRALQWLRAEYQAAARGAAQHAIAIGDSGNDVAMLEAAETALVVRSPVHDFPRLERPGNTMYSTQFGPAGWAEGVSRWLEARGVPGVHFEERQ